MHSFTLRRLWLIFSDGQIACGLQHDPDAPEPGWLEGVAIGLTVFVVVMATALLDYSKERQFQRLNAKSGESTSAVLRNGKQIDIVSSRLRAIHQLLVMHRYALTACL